MSSTKRRAWSGGRGIRTHGDVAATMVFKRMRDWPFIAAPTWAFGVTAFYVIQDHPAYIPCGQRWPLRPELTAPLGVWLSSQLAECAAGRRCWRRCGDVAVLPCCTVYRISSSGQGCPDRFRLDQHGWPVVTGRRCTEVNCNPNCNRRIRRNGHTAQKTRPPRSRLGQPATARRGLHVLAGCGPEDDAEGMADRIGEDPEACLVFRRDPRSAEGKHFLLCPVGIGHADVQVHLLGVSRVGPPRCSPYGGALERQLAQSRIRADDHPISDVLVDDHSQHLGIELGQSSRVRAVDHRLFEASDHMRSMPASENPQRQAALGYLQIRRYLYQDPGPFRSGP